jgi:hypothetical protein
MNEEQRIEKDKYSKSQERNMERRKKVWLL